jgi:hypothetical protein
VCVFDCSSKAPVVNPQVHTTGTDRSAAADVATAQAVPRQTNLSHRPKSGQRAIILQRQQEQSHVPPEIFESTSSASEMLCKHLA